LTCTWLLNVPWSDISRGHQSGELYFASCWYYLEIGDRYHVICYSDDYGQTLSFKYICNIDQGDMIPINLLSDPIDGIFYNYLNGTPPGICISYDHCTTWEQCQGGFNNLSICYTSGNEEGVIYSRYAGNAALFKSFDYAYSFDTIKEDSVYGFLEVGTGSSEIYFSFGPALYNNFEIHYSDNGGESFTLINEFDSIIGGFSFSGNYPRIFRGTNPGELYLVSWHWPGYFKIFYSTNFGEDFEFRFISPICDFYCEEYKFTPGFDQGTFYYIKEIDWFDGINTKVHIYYSDDTASTFTEHVHILDSTFPVSIFDENMLDNVQIELSNYPNPFNNKTTVCFNSPIPDSYTIELTNLSGQAVLRKENYFDAGQQVIKLKTEQLVPGIYLCSIKCQNKVLGVSKIVKGR